MSVNVAAERNEDYLGYKIEATIFTSADSCAVRVRPPKGKSVVFVERIDPVLRYDSRFVVPAADSDFQTWFLSRSIGRARAAIALDELTSLDGAEFLYEGEPSGTLPERELEVLILRALRRIKRLDPSRMGHVPMDALGICILRNLDYDAFDYSDQRLRDRGWADGYGMGWNRHNHNETITELGLQMLDEIERAPDARNDPPRNPTYDSFVSFSFANSDRAGDLAARIERSNMRPFLAIHSIQGGDDFAESIRSGLTDSAEIALLVSKASLASEWVITEWGAAWVLRKRITPILLDVSIGDLPDRLRRLQCIQWDESDTYVTQLKSRQG